MTTVTGETASRAAESKGTSGEFIYRMVADIVREFGGPPATLLDVGCGKGALRPYVADLCREYVGVDALPYPEFPGNCAFHAADLDAARWPVPDEVADVTVSAETVEHLENPRAFFRELARITRPGGLVVVTTPNQLSWLSLLTLLAKGQFNAFQEKPGLYPAHRTALLEIDLFRIALEAGLCEVAIRYSGQGRVPSMARHWPRLLNGRRFSDNIALIGKLRS